MTIQCEVHPVQQDSPPRAKNPCVKARAEIQVTWWRHQMETFSAQLALYAENSPVPVNPTHKGQWRGASDEKTDETGFMVRFVIVQYVVWFVLLFLFVCLFVFVFVCFFRFFFFFYFINKKTTNFGNMEKSHWCCICFKYFCNTVSMYLYYTQSQFLSDFLCDFCH